MDYKSSAKDWIEYHESGEDKYRRNLLRPFLQSQIQNKAEGTNIADIGCGWGLVAEYVTPEQTYIGVDPTFEFRRYIKKNFPSDNIIVKEGELPHTLPIQDEWASLTICSLAFHECNSLIAGISELVRVTLPGGRVAIVTFSDAGHVKLRNDFLEIFDEQENYIRGIIRITPKLIVEDEVHIYSEQQMVNALEKHGTVTTNYLPPYFATYVLEVNKP